RQRDGCLLSRARSGRNGLSLPAAGWFEGALKRKILRPEGPGSTAPALAEQPFSCDEEFTSSRMRSHRTKYAADVAGRAKTSAPRIVRSVIFRRQRAAVTQPDVPE